MSRLRVALVGAGGIAGSSHVPAIRELEDDLELVAIADVDAARAAAAAERWAVPAVYGDVGELLERERPDLVDICTPPGSHTDLCVRSLRAGAWVYCEKPPCRSLAELDAARNELQALRGMDTGHVTIGAMHTMGPIDLSLPLKLFHDLHPGVGLTVNEQSSEEMAEMLRVDELDLAFLRADQSAQQW